MISQSDRDELDRVTKLLDEADVVDREGGSLLSASQRVRIVLMDLEKNRDELRKTRARWLGLHHPDDTRKT